MWNRSHVFSSASLWPADQAAGSARRGPTLSNESWRPKLHLSARNGSVSDPNGLCHFRGTYHFFCQYAPTYPPHAESPHGWGHFVSPDLVHWTFLGCHVMPDCPSDRDGSYSGGAYVADDEIWFYYTGNIRDGIGDGTTSGRLANQTLMKSYNGINLGPKTVVVDNTQYPAYCSCHVRDPKVWEQDGKLHMMLGARTLADSRGSILCYDSNDGESWTFSGSCTSLGEKPFGYMWECPDRIELDGREFLGACPQGMALAKDPDNPGKTSCQNVHAAGYFPLEGRILDVLAGDQELMDASAPRAAIDETTFVDWDYGFDFYACQTLVDEGGRTLLVGWMSLPHDQNDERPYDNPTSTWKGCLTIPRELTLAPDGKILQNPVTEFDALRREAVPMARITDGFVATLSPKVGDIVVSGIDGAATVRFGDFLELVVEDGLATLQFIDDEVGQGRMTRRAKVASLDDLRIVVDTSVLEIYLNGGRTVFSTRYYQEADELEIRIETQATSAVTYPLSPIEVFYPVDR